MFVCFNHVLEPFPASAFYFSYFWILADTMNRQGPVGLVKRDQTSSMSDSGRIPQRHMQGYVVGNLIYTHPKLLSSSDTFIFVIRHQMVLHHKSTHAHRAYDHSICPPHRTSPDKPSRCASYSSCTPCGCTRPISQWALYRRDSP